MYKPDLMTFRSGSPVNNLRLWDEQRLELLDILQREQYGIMPTFSGTTRGEILETDEGCCAGRAVLETVSITFDTPTGDFSFPVHFTRPADGKPRPLLLLLNFRPDVYDKYCPVEEIFDNEFSLAIICYSHITSDDADMSNGLAGCYPRQDPSTDWGKLSMWAFAASRALDYLLTRSEVDETNVGIVGHSRLGKAALICGALDQRIRFTLANDSGCGGDALEQTKHPGAETYADMAQMFPYWFCGNRNKYIENQSQMPYDQHFLLAAIAPRYVALGGAVEDRWADPYSAQLCCIAASPAWQLHGKEGFVGPQEQIPVDSACLNGHVGCHLRSGEHFLSRRDWLYYMDFVKRHLR